MSTASDPSTHSAGGDTAVPVCVHCGEEIRPCPGEAALPKWRDRNSLPGQQCGWSVGFVHASGERAGSHICGKDGNVATPATGQR